MRARLLRLAITFAAVIGLTGSAKAQDFSVLDPYFPVRSFYISLPPADYADEFIAFIKDDMIPGGFNNLIVRVNWSFPFKSHPELID